MIASMKGTEDKRWKEQRTEKRVAKDRNSGIVTLGHCNIQKE